MNLNWHNFEYFLFLLVVLIGPLVLNLLPISLLPRVRKPVFLSILITLLIFSLWDIYAVYSGHWEFNSNYITNLRLINLPIEEVLFFAVVPFACLFIWVELKEINTEKNFFKRCKKIN